MKSTDCTHVINLFSTKQSVGRLLWDKKHIFNSNDDTTIDIDENGCLIRNAYDDGDNENDDDDIMEMKFLLK